VDTIKNVEGKSHDLRGTLLALTGWAEENHKKS
jgi:hypothetical protein